MPTPKFILIVAVIAVIIFVANETGIFESNNPTHNTTQYSIETNNSQQKNTLSPTFKPTPLKNELTTHLIQAGWTPVAAETVVALNADGFPILPQNLVTPPGVQSVAWSPIFNQPLLKGEL